MVHKKKSIAHSHTISMIKIWRWTISQQKRK